MHGRCGIAEQSNEDIYIICSRCADIRYDRNISKRIHPYNNGTSGRTGNGNDPSAQRRAPKRNELFLQLLIAASFITAIEFFAGEILNRRLQMNIWDYSDIPLNFDGQICLPFVFLWIILAAIGTALDDLIRWKMFKEPRNFSYIKTNGPHFEMQSVLSFYKSFGYFQIKGCSYLYICHISLYY